MRETAVPVRFVTHWLHVRPTIAAVLPETWFWADAPLRAELEASIAALVRRQPELLPALRAATRTYRAPVTEGLDPALELAGLLLMLWYAGDAPLRGEVEQMLRGLRPRNPGADERVLALLRSGLEDSGVRVFPGRGPEVQALLAGLLTRLTA